MAELSPIFGFLVIFKDSFKLLSKNGKFMAPITLLSLLLPSLLLLVFCSVYQTLTYSIYKTLDSDSSSNLQNIAYLSLLLVLEITSIMAFAIISNISGIATILVSATSFTDTKISLQELYSRIKITSRRSKLFGYRTSSSKRGTIILAATIVWMLVVLMVIYYPNAFAIAIGAAVGISVMGFLLYASVPTVLCSVVFVLEEELEGSEALEKAEQLIQGQRHHDLMIKTFTNLLLSISFLGFWLVSVNVMGYWLFLVNFLCLAKIFGCVAYTVLYYRCKKYHGDEEVGGVGNFAYSKLSASDLGGGIFPN